MDYQFTIQEMAPQPIVSIRERHLATDMPWFIGQTFGVLFGRLDELGIRPAAPPFVIYHEFGKDTIDAEVCVPVEAVVVGGDVFEWRELPATTVVRTLHIGPYTELGGAYEAITGWLDMHETRSIGPVRERYLNGPGDGVEPAAYATEVEMPILPARVATPV
jgi:effector-binding domain-containing protein